MCDFMRGLGATDLQGTELFFVVYTNEDVALAEHLTHVFGDRVSLWIIPATESGTLVIEERLSAGLFSENILVSTAFSYEKLRQLFRSTNMFTHQFVLDDFLVELQLSKTELLKAIGRIVSLSRTTFIEFRKWFEPFAQTLTPEEFIRRGVSELERAHRLMKPFSLQLAVNQIESSRPPIAALYQVDVLKCSRTTQHHWALSAHDHYFMSYIIDFEGTWTYPKLRKTSIMQHVSINYALNMNTLLGGVTHSTKIHLLSDMIRIPFYPDVENNNFVFCTGHLMRIDYDKIHGPSNLQEPGVYLETMFRHVFPEFKSKPESAFVSEFNDTCTKSLTACRSCPYLLEQPACDDCLNLASCLRGVSYQRCNENCPTVASSGVSTCTKELLIAVGYQRMPERQPSLLPAIGKLTSEASKRQHAARHKFIKQL